MQNLIHVVAIQISDAFQPALRNFLKAVFTPCRTVNPFAVTEFLFLPRMVLRAADDRQSHIGLQSQQFPCRIVEGNDTVTDQEIFIPGIEFVLFELAHAEMTITVCSVEVGKRLHQFLRFHCTQPSVPLIF